MLTVFLGDVLPIANNVSLFTDRLRSEYNLSDPDKINYTTAAKRLQRSTGWANTTVHYSKKINWPPWKCRFGRGNWCHGTYSRVPEEVTEPVIRQGAHWRHLANTTKPSVCVAMRDYVGLLWPVVGPIHSTGSVLIISVFAGLVVMQVYGRTVCENVALSSSH